MRTYTLPPIWDAKKFATRYGLDFGILGSDFYIDGDGKLVVITDFKITDDPPIFEAPDPPVPQGILVWEQSEIPGAVRLVAKFNGKTSAIVGAVGADSTTVVMYQLPGPMGPLPAGPRREFHAASQADIINIPVTPMDGDTLYVENDGEYRRSGGAWHRILTGPLLGSPGDQANLYVALDAAIDAAINPPIGPQIDTRIKAVLIELRKLI